MSGIYAGWQSWVLNLAFSWGWNCNKRKIRLDTRKKWVTMVEVQALEQIPSKRGCEFSRAKETDTWLEWFSKG